MSLRFRNVAMHTVVSLFSGAGGMDLGFVKAGYDITYANDNEKYACMTYRDNLGHHIHEGPITEVNLDDIPESDVIIGGPPCQGFSVAGRMSPDDERSQLVYDFADVVVAKKPRSFVMENVDHLGKSPRFAVTREALIQRFTEAGYTIDERILLASDYGVPQRRKRYFLIGVLDAVEDLDIFPPPCPGLEKTSREVLSDFFPPGEPGNERTINARITTAATPVMRKSPYSGMLFNGLGRPVDLDRPVQTLAATFGGNKTPIVDEWELRGAKKAKSSSCGMRGWNYGDYPLNWAVDYHHLIIKADTKAHASSCGSRGWNYGGKNRPPQFGQAPSRLRRLTVDESVALQGFPADYVLHGPTSALFRQLGNAVPPGLAKAVAEQLKLHLPIDGETPAITPVIEGASNTALSFG